MTTPRRYRNKTERTRDNLKSLLSSIEHRLQVKRGECGQLEDEAARVRKALAEIEALLNPPVLEQAQPIESYISPSSPVPFHPPPPKPSTCPHAKTYKVDGVTRCVECDERVIRTGE